MQVDMILALAAIISAAVGVAVSPSNNTLVALAVLFLALTFFV